MIEVALKGTAGTFAIDVAFSVPAQGITTLRGPSGSGKTTLLRAIAGLTRLSGQVKVGDIVWQDDRRFLAVHKRRVGFVFQEASLLPHLGVAGNLDFALKRNGGAMVDRDGIIARLRLGSLLDRRPDALSGGERQRVAVARALFSAPQWLLMDEPLSSLDDEAKADILPVIAAIGRTLPVLYVSHDLGEVAQLAEQRLSMMAGRVTPTADEGLDGLNDAEVRALALAALKAGLNS